jgi:hypothetical protein
MQHQSNAILCIDTNFNEVVSAAQRSHLLFSFALQFADSLANP